MGDASNNGIPDQNHKPSEKMQQELQGPPKQICLKMSSLPDLFFGEN